MESLSRLIQYDPRRGVSLSGRVAAQDEGPIRQVELGSKRVLFGFYHLHQPWGIPGSVISGVFLYTFPSWRFGSTWMGVIVHSAQSVYFAFLILGVILGLA
jgi:hypothetical protein